MKNILLKFRDIDFFRLLRIKNRCTNCTKRKVTWEEFVMLLRYFRFR